ncbi:MAG: flagellar hook-associated protein FlgK, partial [Clostridia bacterium]|nr:flagellar hook-associated protein FlgK [Clostridia bacterium]
NIANANTEGYTRQSVVAQTTRPMDTANGYIGTGVEVADIRRIREEFLDIQMRTENKSLGEWSTKSDILNKLEVIFNEPSETSIRSVSDAFWDSWQILSKNPESVAVRTTVMQTGITLVNTYNHMETQFKELQEDINKGIAVKVSEVNSIGLQLGDLNDQIVKAERQGHSANDLRDKRDLLLEQLSETVAMDVNEDEYGAVNVTIGGKYLVAGTVVSKMAFTDSDLNPTDATLEWCDPLSGISQGKVRLSGGILKGYVDMRDEVIPKYRDNISLVAKTVAEETNELHREGFGLDWELGDDKVDFFTKYDDTADFSTKNIRINQEILDNLNLIAAASESVPQVYEGDGSNALAIAQLKDKLTMNGDVATFDDFFRSTVGQLGVESQEAQNMENNRSYLIEQLINQRESVSGVSLDEEMANMIMYQHAYTAAARVINTMDEMLDIIVNRLGTVGR